MNHENGALCVRSESRIGGKMKKSHLVFEINSHCIVIFVLAAVVIAWINIVASIVFSDKWQAIEPAFVAFGEEEEKYANNNRTTPSKSVLEGNYLLKGEDEESSSTLTSTTDRFREVCKPYLSVIDLEQWGSMTKTKSVPRRRLKSVRANPLKKASPQKQKICPKTIKQLSSLPKHCNGSLTGDIVIKGERHSGTNWVLQILHQNTCNKAERDPAFGWKHGFLPPLGCGKSLSSENTLLVVTRHAFTWLAKMKENPYSNEMKNLLNLKFSDFIRSPYLHRQSASYLKLCRSHNRDMAIKPNETAENLIQIRTEKYKQWLTGDPSMLTYDGPRDTFLRNRHYFRIESLYANETVSAKDLQHRLIAKPLNDQCVPLLTGNNFKEMSKYTNWDRKKKVPSYDPQKENKELLQKFSKEDLCFVLSQLDLEFEAHIGYAYEDVYEILSPVHNEQE